MVGDLLVLVEDLHPHECVKNEGSELRLLSFRLIREDSFATKVENKCHYKLINSLPDNHLPHSKSN